MSMLVCYTHPQGVLALCCSGICSSRGCVVCVPLICELVPVYVLIIFLSINNSLGIYDLGKQFASETKSCNNALSNIDVEII